jgi:hypothetical protein
MTFAINWDIANDVAWESATAQQVYAWGFRGARYVGRESNLPRTDAVKTAGLQEMSVITGESQGFVPETADWVQLYNEMTSGQSPMTPGQWAYEWNTYKSVFGHRQQHRWCTGGLAMGPAVDIPWLQQALSQIPQDQWPDAIALNPYTLPATGIRDVFDTFWNVFGLPIIATEWYQAADSGQMWDTQCVLNGDGLDGLGARSSQWSSFFCLTDAMTLGSEGIRLGLLDEFGNPKDEYYALLSSPCNE